MVFQIHADEPICVARARVVEDTHRCVVALSKVRERQLLLCYLVHVKSVAVER